MRATWRVLRDVTRRLEAEREARREAERMVELQFREEVQKQRANIKV